MRMREWVFDKPTQTLARIVEFDPVDKTLFRLDDTVPLNKNYPTRWRHTGEVIRDWKPESGAPVKAFQDYMNQTFKQ